MKRICMWVFPALVVVVSGSARSAVIDGYHAPSSRIYVASSHGSEKGIVLAGIAIEERKKPVQGKSSKEKSIIIVGGKTGSTGKPRTMQRLDELNPQPLPPQPPPEKLVRPQSSRTK